MKSISEQNNLGCANEWLEAGGLGGFASGTTMGIRTRRYHALWLNAPWIDSQFSSLWENLFGRGCESFRARFWNGERGFLNDVVDANHQAGEIDFTLRPNQIFAVGGLPFSLFSGERARLIVESVEDQLLTPLGMRSLAPTEAGHTKQYCGGGFGNCRCGFTARTSRLPDSSVVRWRNVAAQPGHAQNRYHQTRCQTKARTRRCLNKFST